jgi:hypothetical protein
LAAKPLWIDAGPGQPSKSVVQLPELPPDWFLHWFFVNEWNGFIRVAARVRHSNGPIFHGDPGGA